MLSFKHSINQALLDKSNQRVFIYTFIISAIAHLYRWTNASFVHDATLVFQHDLDWQVSLGRFIIPYYLKIRRYIAAPFLIGLFATFFLSVSIVFIIRILDVSSWSGILLICGILSTNVTLTSSYAEYLPWTDIYMVSLLFSVFGLYILIYYKNGFWLSGIFISVSMGLYPCYIEIYVALFMFWIILQIIKNQPAPVFGYAICKFLISLAIGGLLYYFGWKLSLRVYDTMPALARNSVAGILNYESLIKQFPVLIFGTYKSFFASFLSSAKLVKICNVLICLVSLIAPFICTRNRRSQLLILILLILLPLYSNFVYILSQGYLTETMRYPHALFFLFPLVLVSKSKITEANTFIMVSLPLLLVLTICTNVIHSNHVYLQKDLEYHSTLSVMTRVIDRIERTDGYIPGTTPVVLIGTLDNSEIALTDDGFDSKSHYATTYYETYQNYFSTVLGYPINILDKDFAEDYYSNSNVIAMASFPSEGCTKIIDGVLVIKLSDAPWIS